VLHFPHPGRDVLTDRAPRTNHPTAVNANLFQGSTCAPEQFNPPNDNCTLGAYPAYSIEATTTADVQLAVNFARRANLRLVVENTGHDYLARSMGAGSLNIWTHNLKSKKYYGSFRQGSYEGPAFKFGADIQAFEAYDAANEAGVTFVGGAGKVISK
jgi:hypothetical protein